MREVWRQRRDEAARKDLSCVREGVPGVRPGGRVAHIQGKRPRRVPLADVAPDHSASILGFVKLHRTFRVTGFVALLALAVWGAEKTWTVVRRARLCAQEYEPPPSGMVFVPAGEFWMGTNDATAEPDEKPLRIVFVPAFYIEQSEVTNRRYREFMKDHRYPPGEDDLPVSFVLKHEAQEFCRRAGRRLPTSAEWEKAARGTDARTYPWGNEFSADRANINRPSRHVSTNAASCQLPLAGASRGKLSGGSFPNGASPYRCHDMAGNVWEWVSDVWRDKSTLGINIGEARGILRGGAFSYSPLQARTSYQGFEALNATCHDVGFRCAMDATVKAK